jgi:uncharacterized protein YbcI
VRYLDHEERPLFGGTCEPRWLVVARLAEGRDVIHRGLGARTGAAFASRSARAVPATIAATCVRVGPGGGRDEGENADRAWGFDTSPSFHSRDPHRRREARSELRLTSPSGDAPSTGALSSAISNAIVRLISEYTGRGPTKARAYITGDLISVVLQDTLTRGERTLVSNGQEALVLQSRKAYQRAMSADMIAAVEQITARRVLAFLSDNHIQPDYAIESFVLESRSDQAAGEQPQRDSA